MNSASLKQPRAGAFEATSDQHQRLARWNRRRLAPALPQAEWRAALDEDHEMKLCEGAMIVRARQEVSAAAAHAPRDADNFVAWFESLAQMGPGQGDGLFPWLAGRADDRAMTWFIEQEAAGEAGFDDLVAMTQVKMPVQAKLELARNYWDEMGRGNRKGMHGGMLEDLSAALNITPCVETTLWPSLALANTMAAMATNRAYAYHSLGALGVIELTAPGRAVYVAKGLKRLGIDAKARHYFDLHAVLDVHHSQAWNREVLRPLVASNPACGRAIAEGALMRLTCGARCFAAYRAHLWATDAQQRAGQV